MCVASLFLSMFFFNVPQLKEVVLKSGKVLRADVCIIGTGEAASSDTQTLVPQ